MFQKPKRVVNTVFLHCSASDNPKHDDISVIRKWHVEERGWSDVGYHYFITKEGEVQEGRDLEKIPAAQKGFNKGSIAICLHGLLLENFTEEQFDALRQLCSEINEAYDGNITFHGHREVNPRKSCPVFDVDEVLGLDENKKLRLV